MLVGDLRDTNAKLQRGQVYLREAIRAHSTLNWGGAFSALSEAEQGAADADSVARA